MRAHLFPVSGAGGCIGSELVRPWWPSVSNIHPQQLRFNYETCEKCHVFSRGAPSGVANSVVLNRATNMGSCREMDLDCECGCVLLGRSLLLVGSAALFGLASGLHLLWRIKTKRWTQPWPGWNDVAATRSGSVLASAEVRSALHE